MLTIRINFGWIEKNNFGHILHFCNHQNLQKIPKKINFPNLNSNRLGFKKQTQRYMTFHIWTIISNVM